MLGPMPQVPPTVLLLSSNGAGMGHLTRLLAYARRLPGEVRPYVLSLSQAAPVVGLRGIPWEYLPSQGATGLRPASWRRLFTDRVSEVLDRVRPAVLVFDGTHPYSGLDVALADHPRTRAVWSRRGLWRPGRNVDQLAKSAWFDVVLEPGDLAAAEDRGATAGATDAVRVRPVTLLDADECSSRQSARAELGLPQTGALALVSLGAGNINDVGDEVGAATEALREHGVAVCVTAPAIAERAYASSDVHLVRHFPLSQHLAAFDYVVSAAGYNSFHETLRLGVPALFVPNRHTSLDDQEARARHAHLQGWALSTTTLTGGRGRTAVGDLIRRGPDLAAAARSADPGNGAADAADVLMELI